MDIRTLKDIETLEDKKVLLRVDFNVPINKTTGEIEDDTRIAESLPTIKFLSGKEAKIIIMSHLGRPDGEIQDGLRLTKIGEHLSKLLNKPVKKLNEVLSENVKAETEKMQNGEIILLENMRFRKEEEECEPNFTKELASLGEIFVNDAFGTAHRKHASTTGLADFLPAYAGLLMEKEITELSKVLEETPAKPITMIFGGAKIDTKIGIIQHFLDKADYFLIGGGLANTFLFAKSINIGDSLCEKDKVDIAKQIIEKLNSRKNALNLPTDVVVAKELSNETQAQEVAIGSLPEGMKILDIGSKTAEHFSEIIKKSSTVIWNGPVGVYEFKPFMNGTKQVAQAIAESECVSIIGGGDTADAIKKLGIAQKKFTHISTGGGACIEFLSGDKLPGIEILRK
ncbi:phosphoglycerate kinase [Candidatus Peregrinibacteria bacterium CG_4_10_14_0_2_um_filter_38_24]|nr:MAG: phosphoglycerate kinase [Candidatus Peregrinibacteria bacterium CG_4_10_14_0_2_um_filter_38_24]PJC39262.1 MAG: phosphoglycerate kinase [Candidatus Peregrinibacteria bacterium CG_4_9_14_0_2_um_filter_38_9]